MHSPNWLRRQVHRQRLTERHYCAKKAFCCNGFLSPMSLDGELFSVANMNNFCFSESNENNIIQRLQTAIDVYLCVNGMPVVLSVVHVCPMSE